MSNEASNRRLRVAMAGSIAAHVGMIASLVWLVDRDTQPTSTPTIPMVNLTVDARDAQDATAAVDAPATTVAGAAASDPAPTSQSARDDLPPPPPSELKDVAPAPVRQNPSPAIVAVAPEPAAQETSDATQPVAPSRPVDESAHASTAPAVSPSAGSAVASDAVPQERVTANAAQTKMLQRKFRRWSEDFYSVAANVDSETWTHKGQQFVARFERLPAAGDMDIERVAVDVSTLAGGERLTTRLTMKRLAFSNFAQFIHRWDPAVQIHDDELNGRFHANSKVNVLYDRDVQPVFFGKFTTSSRQVDFSGTRARLKKKEIFRGGIQTGVRSIALPRRAQPFPSATGDTEPVTHIFDDDTKIRFYADGTYAWRTIGTVNDDAGRAPLSERAYLIGGRGVELRVSGVLRGRVLVYSPQSIVIDGDLIYAHAPHALLGADDYLGLVSDKYIAVAGPDVTGPGDLSIHGSIYARRRFTVKRYRSKGNALLYIYGSLTAGTLSATEPRFRTRIDYDKRLENKRAPGFPVSNRFDVAAWDGDWHVVPLADVD